MEVIDRHWTNPEVMGLGVLLICRVTEKGLDSPNIFKYVAGKDHKLVHDTEAAHFEGEGPLLMRVTIDDLIYQKDELPSLDPALTGWLTDLMVPFPNDWHHNLLRLATEGKLEGCTVITRMEEEPIEFSGKGTAAPAVRPMRIKRADYKFDHVACWIPSLLFALSMDRPWVRADSGRYLRYRILSVTNYGYQS